MKIDQISTDELWSNGKLQSNQADWTGLNQKWLNPIPRVGTIVAHFKISGWFLFRKYTKLDFPLGQKCSTIPSNNQLLEKYKYKGRFIH